MSSRGASILLVQALLIWTTVQAQSATNATSAADSEQQYTGILRYKPNIAANVIFGGLYIVVGLISCYHIHRRSDKWALCLPIGAFASGLGFFIRLALDPLHLKLATYVLQQLLIVVSPSAFLAFNYMLYGRLVAAIDPKFGGSNGKSQSKTERSRFSFIPPLIVGRAFVWSDIATFIIQMGAGGLQALPNSQLVDIGSKLFLAGVTIQGISYCLFTALFTVAMLRLIADRRRNTSGQKGSGCLGMDANTGFIVGGLYISSVLVITRSIYRIIEFSQGYHGYLITHEVYLFALDAGPLVLSIGIWSIFWPTVLLDKIAVETRRKEQNHNTVAGHGHVQTNGNSNDWVPLV